MQFVKSVHFKISVGERVFTCSFRKEEVYAN